jgi:WD40 repeat protein
MKGRIAFLVAVLLAAPLVAADTPVSFFREVVPILRANCNGCHKPGKAKGNLDLTTHAALMKGGKHGDTVRPGNAKESRIWESIVGDEPEMPKDADPLTKDETAVIERWISQGAKDDTPADGGLHRLAAPPVYHSLPAVTAMAWSPDGALLAVSGFHEILLHRADGSGIVARLSGESPRIESLAFSPDGKILAASGGAPSEYGQIQIWNVAGRRLIRAIQTTQDVVYGVSLSPDGSRVAVGCTDKLVRVFSVADGREVMRCDNHIDWVFGTAFSLDGARVVSAGRDKAIKLIDLASGRLIDDVSKPREPLTNLARHPKENMVVAGSVDGGLRLFRMEPRGGRLAEGDDKENSFVKEMERMPGAITALAISTDGARLAVACASGEARVFSIPDGKRLAMMKGVEGALFAVAISPDGQRVATAGYDGKIRFFGGAKFEMLQSIDAVPLAASAANSR